MLDQPGVSPAGAGGDALAITQWMLDQPGVSPAGAGGDAL